jgi:Cu+-exporting ATPase
MTNCAVCNMAIDESEAKGKTTHDGVEYYFCSEDCEKKFEANRDKYLKKPAKTTV